MHHAFPGEGRGPGAEGFWKAGSLFGIIAASVEPGLRRAWAPAFAGEHSGV
jgi:hypothetical protein